MTDSKKSAPSASNPTVLSSEARKNVNPLNAMPHLKKTHCERYLYGGMLFPSRILASNDKPSREHGIR